MNIGKISYQVFNYITLGLPEIERRENLRIRARERLEERFGSLEDDGSRIHQSKKKSFIQEDKQGNAIYDNQYFEGTRVKEESEKRNIEKRKIRDEIRPDTSSQKFLDGYFPSKVPIGEKKLIHAFYELPYGYSPVIGYSRDIYHHSSLRDTVGLYHSLLTLDMSNNKISEREYKRRVSDLEGFLDRIKQHSHLIKTSINPSNYRNVSNTENLDFLIEISKELK